MLPSPLKGTTMNIVQGPSWLEPHNLHMALLFHLPLDLERHLVSGLLLYSPQNLHSQDYHVALLFHLPLLGRLSNKRFLLIIVPLIPILPLLKTTLFGLDILEPHEKLRLVSDPMVSIEAPGQWPIRQFGFVVRP